jgi:hypothetical protein
LKCIMALREGGRRNRQVVKAGNGWCGGRGERSRRSRLEGGNESDNKAPKAEGGMRRHEEVKTRTVSGARVACTGYIKRGRGRWAAAG